MPDKRTAIIHMVLPRFGEWRISIGFWRTGASGVFTGLREALAESLLQWRQRLTMLTTVPFRKIRKRGVT